MTSIFVRHNPANGPLPTAVARVYRDHIAAMSDSGRCGRCGRDLDVHVWQVVDPDDTEQDGVIDCAVN